MTDINARIDAEVKSDDVVLFIDLRSHHEFFRPHIRDTHDVVVDGESRALGTRPIEDGAVDRADERLPLCILLGRRQPCLGDVDVFLKLKEFCFALRFPGREFHRHQLHAVHSPVDISRRSRAAFDQAA